MTADVRGSAAEIIDVPPPPLTDEDIAALPVLDMDAFRAHLEEKD